MRAMGRRSVLSGLLVILAPTVALGGSYLSRAAVLLNAAEVEARSLRRRLHDRKLAKMLHRLALARVEAARAMEVPKEVIPAHPHLLLVLESHERAADAAVRGEHERFLVALARAREEQRTFESVLQDLGWTLPQS